MMICRYATQDLLLVFYRLLWMNELVDGFPKALSQLERKLLSPRDLSVYTSVGLWDAVRPTVDMIGFNTTYGDDPLSGLAAYKKAASRGYSAVVRATKNVSLVVQLPGPVNCSAQRFTKDSNFAARCQSELVPNIIPALRGTISETVGPLAFAGIPMVYIPTWRRLPVVVVARLCYSFGVTLLASHLIVPKSLTNEETAWYRYVRLVFRRHLPNTAEQRSKQFSQLPFFNYRGIFDFQ